MHTTLFAELAPVFVLCVVFISTYFFITEKICAEVVSLSATAALTFYCNIFLNCNILKDSVLNPTIISVIGILILGSAISCTSIINSLIMFLVKIKNIKIIYISVIVFIYLSSAFLNNTPIVAVFASLIAVAATKSQISSKKIMMPIAFSASLGAMLTVLGSSTNIILQSKLNELGQHLEIFSFFLPGLFISLPGLIYCIALAITIKTPKKDEKKFISKKFFGFLKSQNTTKLTLGYYTTEEIKQEAYKYNKDKDVNIEEFFITQDSPLIGTNQSSFDNIKKLDLLGAFIEDGKNCILPGKKIYLISAKQSKKYRDNNDDLDIFQLGITKIKKDSFQILGKKSSLKLFLIFAFVIISSAFSFLPLAVNAFLGVCTIAGLKIFNPRQLLSFVDTKVFFMIIYAFSVGKSMESSGALTMISNWLYVLLNDLPVLAIAFLLFVFIVMLNEVISNNAVGLIFAPVVIDLSQKITAEPKTLIWTLIFAANSAFLTPFGYQTNLIVMRYGGYNFLDYFKFGLPLTLIVITFYMVFLWFFAI